MWHGSDSSTQKSSCVSQGTKFWEALPRDTASHMENGKILEMGKTLSTTQIQLLWHWRVVWTAKKTLWNWRWGWTGTSFTSSRGSTFASGLALTKRQNVGFLMVFVSVYRRHRRFVSHLDLQESPAPARIQKADADQIVSALSYYTSYY